MPTDWWMVSSRADWGMLFGLPTLTIRSGTLILYKKYSPNEYPKYDNYDAINVNKTDHIPVDFAGPMGVPIRLF